MLKILKWVVIGFVVLVVLAAIFGKDSSNSQQPATDQSKTTQTKTDVPAQDVYKTTAAQLFKDYESNEVAADEKMKGKSVEVSGTIQSIDKDFADNIVLQLKTANEFMPAHMNLEDSEKQKAMALSKNAKVTVLCKKVARMVGSPIGSECVLQ